MKKSAAEIAELGWQPCEPPRVAIGFRWPHKEVVKCKNCYGKGWLFMYDQGYGKAFGRCYKKKCACRGGQQAVLYVDKELRVVLDWFKGTPPPNQGFELWQFRNTWKVVEDPVAYWEWLRTEIATDNIYTLEALRDELLQLYKQFSLDDEF